MRQALINNKNFIFILCVWYVVGVWLTPLVYFLYPVILIMMALKKKYFELFITFIWIVILSDYVAVEGADYNDLQWAKDMKNLNLPIMLAAYLLDFKNFKSHSVLFKKFGIFFIFSTIGLIYSFKLDVGIQKTISFILLYLLIPEFFMKIFSERKEKFLLELVCFVVGMLTIGIVLRFAAPQIAMLDDRFKSIFGNPNGLGVFLVFTFLLIYIINHYYPNMFNRRDKIFIFIIMALSIFWSGSRNTIITVLIFYGASLINQFNVFLSFLLAFVVYIFNDYIDFVALIQVLGLEDYFRVNTIETGSGRKIAWGFAWIQIQKYFFFGGGFAHDENVMRPNYAMLSRLGHQGGVHNSYLSLWFDVGIIGLILYFRSLISIIIFSAKKEPLAWSFLIATLFNIIYESWLVGSLNPFSIMFLSSLTLLAHKEYFVPETIAEEGMIESDATTAVPAI